MSYQRQRFRVSDRMTMAAAIAVLAGISFGQGSVESNAAATHFQCTCFDADVEEIRERLAEAGRVLERIGGP